MGDLDGQARRDLAAKLTHGALLIRTPSGFGSGVMVGDYVLTAAHVVLPDAGQGQHWNPETTSFDVGTGRNRFEARLVAHQSVYDIALLEPAIPAKANWVPRFDVSGDAQIGDPIWVAGYPFGTEVPVVRRGLIASIVMPEEATMVDRNMFVSAGSTFPSYWIDVPIFEGNSGGPVLNDTGGLIGLANRTMKVEQSIAIDSTDEGDTQFAPVPIYMDIGIALRLDLAIPRTGLDRLLTRVDAT